MDYIVTADYYDWRGLFTLNRYWVIDDEHTFYKTKDSENEVKELINKIDQFKDLDHKRVDINVYELGNKVTDKFI